MACITSQGLMVRDPSIYKSGITGVSSQTADAPDRSFCDPDSLSPLGSTHLTFFPSTGFIILVCYVTSACPPALYSSKSTPLPQPPHPEQLSTTPTWLLGITVF